MFLLNLSAYPSQWRVNFALETEAKSYMLGQYGRNGGKCREVKKKGQVACYMWPSTGVRAQQQKPRRTERKMMRSWPRHCSGEAGGLAKARESINFLVKQVEVQGSAMKIYHSKYDLLPKVRTHYWGQGKFWALGAHPST